MYVGNICHACAGQRQLMESVFSPTMWVPRTKFR